MAYHTITTKALQQLPQDWISPEKSVVKSSCIANLTADCFDRMNANLVQKRQQSGGAPRPPPGYTPRTPIVAVDGNYDSIIPYLIAHNIQNVTTSTLIPTGILKTANSKVKGKFDDLIHAGQALTSSQLSQINVILKHRPKLYM